MSQIVVFRLESQEYGIPIGMAREIVRDQNITPLPLMPEGLLGIVNLRGSVIPVWDLHVRFGGVQQERMKDNQLLVLQVDGNSIGVVVDDVTEVTDFEEAALETLMIPFHDSGKTYSEKIIKQDDRLIVILGENRFRQLQQ